MRRVCTWWIGALALACHSNPATRVPDDAEATAVATIDGDDLARHVKVLASDAYEGRFPGEAGETKTLAYITAELARHGIAPAGIDGYLQPVPLSRMTVDSTSAITLTRPDGTATKLSWGADLLAWSDGTVTRAKVPVVFVGYGITAPEYAYDDYGGADVRGAVVVTVGGEPSARDGDATWFQGEALTHHASPYAKVEAASRAGAVALVELRADGEHGIAWSVLVDGARAPKYDLVADRPHVAARGLVRADRFDAAFADGAVTTSALRREADGPDFVARDLGIVADLDLRTAAVPVTSHNVVGWIEGSERPDEIVVYTAHWDHVGTRNHLSGDKIFNGAVDNATGTAALLELAAAFAALDAPPRRSILFLATTAEEQGLLGARHYVAQPIFPLRNTVGVINMDALFPFGSSSSMTVVGMGSSELEDYLAEAARQTGRTLHPDPTPQAGAFFRSDHFPFAERGVPAVFAVGGPTPQQLQSDPARLARYADYLQHRYHQPADEYDAATWDMSGIVQDVQVYFRAGLALANDDAFPNWRPDHPFRARRDAMREADAG